MKDDCFRCEDMKKAGKPEDEQDEAHSDCHGWTHCGPDCCGACPYCGECDEAQDGWDY